MRVLHGARAPAAPRRPFDVAGAIPEAATYGKRAIKVSAMVKMNTALAKFAPAIGDRMAEKQTGRQQYDEPPRDPGGSLYEPKRTDRTYGIHGRG